MLLTARTTLYITGKDGTSEMSFAAFRQRRLLLWL
jgi:hypothetical protein